MHITGARTLGLEDNCPICSELRCASDSRFASALGAIGLRNLIGPSGDRLAVIPSLGALDRGHLLIVTKAHSGGVLAVCTDEGIRTELRTLIAALTDKFVVGHADSVLLFEHGSSRIDGDKNLCSTTHGHLHFLPLQADVSANAFAMVSDNVRIVELDEMAESAGRLDEYLAFARIGVLRSPVTGFVRGAEGLESQFARRIVAKALGLKKWRWQEFDNDVTNIAYLEQSSLFRRNAFSAERLPFERKNAREALSYLAL